MADSFLAAFRKQVVASPDRLALQDGSLAMSYQDLDAATDAVARQLHESGLRIGSVVGYTGGCGAGRVVAYIASWKAGTTFVWLDPAMPEPALLDLMENSQAEAIMIESEAQRSAAQTLGAPPIVLPSPWPTRPETPPFVLAEPIGHINAYIRYTSGSTGKPKGVEVQRRAEDHSHNLYLDQITIPPDERTAIFPHFWPSTCIMPLRTGASMHYFDFNRRGPRELMEWLETDNITWAFTFPAVFRAMADEPNARLPDCLHFLMLSGEPLLRRDAERFDRMTRPGAVLGNSYGSSEHIFLAHTKHVNGEPVLFDTMPMGFPYEPGEIHIVDEDDRPVPPGVEGQIVSTSLGNFSRYRRNPERTAQTLRTFAGSNERPAYFTGDRGYFDAAGVLHPAGRADDQIKIRGYTLRTLDVEQEVLSFPGIRRAVVVGFDGPRDIKRLACHFEPEEYPGPSGTDIRAYLSARMPAYMVPGYFIAHKALPVTSSGKMIRRGLPNPLEAQSARSADGAYENETERQLAAIWRDILGHGDFGRTEDFFDVGGDSLQAMAMLVSAEQCFKLRVPLESLILNGATIASLAARITKALVNKTGPSLVAMNRGGAAAPLYALHVTGGHLSDYLELAHALDGIRPMFGISPRGLEQATTADTSINEVARHAAETILDSGHPGPHTLIGFSAGGAFALETARQLIDAGAPPPRLIVLDTNCAWLDRLRWVRMSWRALRGGDAVLSGQRLLDSMATPTGLKRKPQNLDEAHLRALLAHRPTRLPLPHALLVVGSEGLITDADQAEWARLLGPGLEVMNAPGDHMSMIRAPNVAALVQRLEAWLRA